MILVIPGNTSSPVTGLGIGTPKISFSQDSGDSGVGMDVAVLQPPTEKFACHLDDGPDPGVLDPQSVQIRHI